MRNTKTLNLTLIAVFFALILMQSYIPNLGYIRILPMLPSISTLVLTVSIAGALLGPKSGAVVGLLWGIVSWFMAFTQPGDPLSLLLFQNFVIAVVPRVLVGLFSGLIANLFANKGQSLKIFGFGLSGFIGAMTNTILVIVFTSIFFLGNPETITSHLGAIDKNSPLIFILLSVLGFNGIVEAIVTSIFTPIVVVPLRKVMKRLKNS